MNKFFIRIIRAYQLIFSPVFTSLGGGCRFYPSCSEYSKEAFERFGFFKAVLLTLKRILKCNPLHQGGIDKIKG